MTHLLKVSPGLFNSINDALEVKQRTMAVNDKITYAAEVGPTSWLPSLY
jgi:hypothetical protein